MVEEFKLFGVKITCNLKWEANTDYITKKAYKRLWIIRRLKNLRMSTRSLVKVLTTKITVVVPSPGTQCSHYKGQKSAIILSPNYISYDEALKSIPSTSGRRNVILAT